MSARVVIVGNGIAGISAALRLRELDQKAAITVISEETELFFSRTALMYVYLRQLQFKDTIVYPKEFYRRRNIGLLQTAVTGIDAERNTISTADGQNLGYDFLLLATGSRPRLPGLSGEQLAGVQGLYSRPDLEKLEAQSRKGIAHAVIAGGGLIGVELAEMLVSRKIPVTFLVREKNYFGQVLPEAEAEMVTREVRKHVADLRLATTLAAIEGDADRKLRAIITSTGDTIPCDLLGLTIGVEPRTELAASAGLARNRGILTNAQLQTSRPNVFAAGDAAEVPVPGGEVKVQQIWYSGRLQGETAGANIAAAIKGAPLREYNPGIYFNSARFFALDYQVYGSVPATSNTNNSLLWRDAESRRAVRICFAPGTTPTVIGLHAFGTRLNHKVCERWIVETRSLAYAIEHFAEAIFDPEFSRSYLPQLHAAWRTYDN